MHDNLHAPLPEKLKSPQRKEKPLTATGVIAATAAKIRVRECMLFVDAVSFTLSHLGFAFLFLLKTDFTHIKSQPKSTEEFQRQTIELRLGTDAESEKPCWDCTAYYLLTLLFAFSNFDFQIQLLTAGKGQLSLPFITNSNLGE